MYNRYTGSERAVAQVRTEASTVFLAKVFNWMAIGLGLTGLAAFMTVNSQTALQLVFGNKMVFYGLIFFIFPPESKKYLPRLPPGCLLSTQFLMALPCQLFCCSIP